MPALKVNHRSSARPRPTSRLRPEPSACRTWAVASTGSRGMPRARAKTLAEPPGTTASAGPSGARCPRAPDRAAGALQHPVDDLVDGAVAAVRDQQLDAVAHGLRGRLGRVAAVAGEQDLQLELARERVRQDVAAGGGRRRRVGVHHQQRAHSGSVAPPILDAVARDDRPASPRTREAPPTPVRAGRGAGRAAGARGRGVHGRARDARRARRTSGRPRRSARPGSSCSSPSRSGRSPGDW